MPKKRGLKTFKKAVRTLREAGSRKNPPFWSDAFFYVAPAVVSYSATRLVGRATRKFLAPKFPKAAPYLSSIGALAATGTLYYACKASPDLRKYRDQLLVGASIACAQSLLLAAAPQFAWLFDLPVPTRALPARRPALTAADAALDALERQQGDVGGEVTTTAAAEEEVALEGDGSLGIDDEGDVGSLGSADPWASPLAN